MNKMNGKNKKVGCHCEENFNSTKQSSTPVLNQCVNNICTIGRKVEDCRVGVLHLLAMTRIGRSLEKIFKKIFRDDLIYFKVAEILGSKLSFCPRMTFSTLTLAAILSTGIVGESRAVTLNVYDVVLEFPDCTHEGGATNGFGVAAFSCTSCPAGWYLNDTTCYPCNTGYYCPGGTSGKIKACTGTNYSSVNRATNIDEAKCTPCPNGYTVSSNNNICSREGMTSCPEGQQYSKGKCSTCRDGMYCAGGTSSEQTCPAGYQCFGGKKEPCPAGTYFAGTFSAHGCHPCPNGKVSVEGSQNCGTSCPAGTVQDGKACKNLPGCLSFANGACQECDTDYLTNSEGTCTPEAECNNGLHKTTDGACVANDDVNCNTQTGNKCTECKSGYLEQGGGCVTSCGAGYKDMGGFCNRIQYTPAEAAAILNDDNNTITITFKK